jgi:prepilin-type processing-associated H-X9-DG protein
MADNEDGPGREIIKKETDTGIDKCDVWTITHLPNNVTTPSDRRVSRNRHSHGKTKPGCHYLFLDWHVEWMASGDEIKDVKELIKKWNYDF